MPQSVIGMQTESSAPDRVRLPISFDLEALRREVAAMPLHAFIEYSVLPLTSPRRVATDVDDYADGRWAEWPPTDLLATSPYLTEVVDSFRRRTRVTLVRLLRLAPGGVIAEHTDPTLGLEVERSLIRLTIPIFTNDRVTFHLNDTPVPWRPGECWYLRFSDPHRGANDGDTERIHLSIDVEPNESIRALVAASHATERLTADP